MSDPTAPVAFARAQLARLADPIVADGMARYLKTDMPFFGVKTPHRLPIGREIAKRWPPATPADYRTLVGSLWTQPERECKYLAIWLAGRHRHFVTGGSLALYRRMIEEGAWWDLVDGIAADLAGGVLLRERETTTPIMRAWLADEDRWLRRTAVICQLKHREHTDAALLFDACRACAGETDVFLRKAIGWALRQYARTEPDAVQGFLDEMGDRLSGLSRREAARHL